ncbi:MAG: quinonprotein alcohol dehydrogenase [Blastopirellula sp.]|nr:MAG: quinonprotein alcohol dehydrogenase [Blastopirellula sp.]
MLYPILLLLVLTGVDANWPQFRGPNLDGHAQNSEAPITWSEKENVAWKVPIDGLGHSSPVALGTQAWLTTATMQDETVLLWAWGFDLESGKVTHKILLFEITEPQNLHKLSSHSSPTSVLEPGRGYFHFGSYGTACVDTTTGKVLWKRDDIIIDHRHGPGSSPILVDDLLIVNFDGMDRQFVTAFDKTTGKTRWQKKRDIKYGTENGERKKAFCTPLLIEHNGRQELISTAAQAVIAYDPSTGKELWRVHFFGDSATARPVFGNGLLFITTSCTDSKMWAVRPGGNGNVTETHVAWKETRGIPQRPSPLYHQGLLYLMEDKGIMNCLDSATGEVLWKERLAGNYTASPILVNGKIYVTSEEGKTVVLQPGKEFQLISENLLETGCVASPAVLPDGLLLRTSTHLYKLKSN